MRGGGGGGGNVPVFIKEQEDLISYCYAIEIGVYSLSGTLF